MPGTSAAHWRSGPRTVSGGQSQAIDRGRGQVDEERIEGNDPVRLDIRFRNDFVERPVVVRRRESSRFGFELHQPPNPNSPERLRAYQRMVRSLDQVWLKNRLS